MISVLLSGYGNWGRVLARNILAHPDFFLEAVHDPSSEARHDARLANLHTYRTFADALDGTNASVVILATPIEYQVDAAIMAIQRYRHVMMAKPGPRTLIDAERLYNAADAKGRSVVVDYTMMMADGYQDIQRTTSKVYAADAIRRAEGRRSTANIIDDLAVHDVAMLVGLDAEMRVRTANVSEDSASIILENVHGVPSIRILSEYNAEETERTLIVNGVEWNQLRKGYGPGPVWERLSSLKRVVRGEQSDNRLVVFETTRILEEIKRAKPRPVY
jgi:predicted dehydrogenase